MEKVLLVGTKRKNEKEPSHFRNSFEELERLSETAGGTVVGKMLQSISKPDPATFIGKGKAEELRTIVLEKKIATLIFDDELKPAQQKNLAEMIPAKILDRTRLILDIFARRARTREGILQVELAQLSYLLPRMTERYGRFEQQVGGIGTRGPGERKLEVEARHIRDRMSALKKQIELIKLHRAIARERRHNVPLPTVAIVGYTNAGKSTLLNTLVQSYGQWKEPIYADDKLFATLDPTTRRIRIPSGRWALFTDTVGFIKKLPTHLIAAFRSTLEELLEADLLIHLIDAGDSDRDEQAKVVFETLRALAPDPRHFDGKVIIVYNKMDMISNMEKASLLKNARSLMENWQMNLNSPEPCWISAVRRTGILSMLSTVEDGLSKKMVETDLHLSYHKLKLLPSLYRLGQVEMIHHRSRGIDLHLKLEKSHWNKLQQLLSSKSLKGTRTLP